ncbi:MAG: 16S rRNA (cytidine(1402)-2'-O)-methyltransferase, partial [Eubacteriales bacterium]
NALALSALPTGRFAFEGFLSTNKAERKKHLESAKSDTHTLIFYEAPHKLKVTLADMLLVFGDRKISLCRELTKINEEIMRTTLSGACEYYSANEPRGEYVLVIEGAGEETKDKSFFSDMTVSEHIDYYVSSGMKKMDAIKAVAKDRDMPKNEIYKQSLK